MWWFEGALGLSIGLKTTKTRYGFFHIYPLNKPKFAHLRKVACTHHTPFLPFLRYFEGTSPSDFQPLPKSPPFWSFLRCFGKSPRQASKGGFAKLCHFSQKSNKHHFSGKDLEKSVKNLQKPLKTPQKWSFLRKNKATRRWQNMPKMTILTITFLGLFIEVLGMFEMLQFPIIFSGLFIEVFGGFGK